MAIKNGMPPIKNFHWNPYTYIINLRKYYRIQEVRDGLCNTEIRTIAKNEKIMVQLQEVGTTRKVILFWK